MPDPRQETGQRPRADRQTRPPAPALPGIVKLRVIGSAASADAIISILAAHPAVDIMFDKRLPGYRSYLVVHIAQDGQRRERGRVHPPAEGEHDDDTHA